MDPVTAVSVSVSVSASVLGVLAAAFNELYQATEVAVRRATSFRHELELLQATLNIMRTKISLIDQVASRNQSTFPGELQEEIQRFNKRLMSGKDLVMTCSEIPRWRISKRYRYAKKITTLNESLGHLARVELPGVQLDLILRVLNQMNTQSEPELGIEEDSE